MHPLVSNIQVAVSHARTPPVKFPKSTQVIPPRSSSSHSSGGTWIPSPQ